MPESETEVYNKMMSYGPNGAAYAGSGSLWRRLESSLAYLSCFATGKSFFGGEG